jgi:hypothetical protein
MKNGLVIAMALDGTGERVDTSNGTGERTDTSHGDRGYWTKGRYYPWYWRTG